MKKKWKKIWNPYIIKQKIKRKVDYIYLCKNENLTKYHVNNYNKIN